MEKLITDFSLGLFFWQTLLFIILVIFLRKYAWKPILSAVEQREEGIKYALASAEKAKAEMESLNADNVKILAAAKIERDGMLKEASNIKEEIIKEAKDSADKEAEKIISSAKKQIAREKMKAIVELKNKVATLSIDIAEKVLKRELNKKESQEKFIVEELKKTDLN
jgi:F-type H+-transporting ATPase subunit b